MCATAFGLIMMLPYFAYVFRFLEPVHLVARIEREEDNIAADRAGEDPGRLHPIREQLARVESKKYWQIIDRGRNSDYMPPRQKEQMDRFFTMLDHDAVR